MKKKWIAMALAMGMVVTNLPLVSTFAEDIKSTSIEGTTIIGTDTVGTDTVGTDTVGTDTVGTDTVGTDTIGTGTIGTGTVGTTTVTTSTAGEENSNVSDFVFDKSTGTISSYKGTAKIVTIPSEIDGVAVKRIKGTNKGIWGQWEHSLSMFTSQKGMNNVEKVIIPSSVEVIEQFTFMGCINLKEIQLSEGLKKIGSYAFYACSFEKVNIPESVIEIRKGAFSKIEELKEINFPKGIKQINDEVAYGCENLEKITIPKYATIIGAPFENTVWGKSIKQNNNGFYIINNTLCGYSGTDEIVNIPDGVKTINREAFYDYTIIDKSIVTQVPAGANEKEETVPIPTEATPTVQTGLEAIKNKIDPIDDAKIYENSKIKEVVVPASVNLIKRQAFSNCTQLKSINIANPNVQIGEYCFRDNVVITIGNKVYTQAQINNSKFDFDKSTGTIKGYKGNQTTLTIPSEIDGVKVLYIEASSELKAKGYGILGDNLTVEKVIIPGEIKVIKSGAFKNSINLYSIEFAGYTQATEAGAYQGCSNLINLVNPVKELNKDKDAYKDTAWQTVQDGPKISTTGRGIFDDYPDKAETGEKSNTLLALIMTILSGTFVYKSYKKKKIQN